jgi:cellobiose phosphorylase
MNLIGQHGKGESVWLAFFLCDVLKHFSVLAKNRGDMALAQQCEEQTRRLRENIEKNAWDGQWYRRAYFDNGEPLGSASNPECQIDSLPQSWAALTGVGDPERTRLAMAAVVQRLVRRDRGLIQLFDPPFDKSSLEPGYIKGYLPGVRENGGQYTHGAIWMVMALATMGEANKAWDLFNLINPVRHADSPAAVARYKVEPYVVAADVYSVLPHTGRGGWTWYTGSAGWLYRLITETFLGLHIEVDKLSFAPCLPTNWKFFKLHYRHRETPYQISLFNDRGAWLGRQRVVLDDVELPDDVITLKDDHTPHNVEVHFC